MDNANGDNRRVLNSVCNKLEIDLCRAVKDKEEENIKRECGK